MLDYLNIGSSPAAEPCVQVGSQNYAQRAKIECLAFIAQLEEQFPKGQFSVKAFPHDFGTYYEVVAYYDAEVEDGRMEAAFAAESEAWESWRPSGLAVIKQLNADKRTIK